MATVIGGYNDNNAAKGSALREVTNSSLSNNKVGLDVSIKEATNVLDAYQISDDDQGEDTQYRGFLDKDGNWYIQRYVISTGTYRYFAGTSDYTTNWTNRASLAYDYFNVIF